MLTVKEKMLKGQQNIVRKRFSGNFLSKPSKTYMGVDVASDFEIVCSQRFKQIFILTIKVIHKQQNEARVRFI